MKEAEFINELERNKEVIEKAEKDHLLLTTSNLAFTPAMLIDELREGGWHCCNWRTIKPKEYGDKLREEMEEVKTKYNNFVKMLEGWK